MNFSFFAALLLQSSPAATPATPVYESEVSQSVRDHIGTKLALAFEESGNQQLKSIEKPVRVFDVVLDEAAKAAGPRPSTLVRS